MPREILRINIKKIQKLTKDSNKVKIDKESENILKMLFFLKYKIDEAIENAKMQIEVEGNKLIPHFKGFVGEDISATYRAYGSKYVIENPETNEYSKVNIRYTPDTEKIEKYLEEHGELPMGVKFADRKPKLTFNTKKFDEKLDQGKIKFLDLFDLVEKVPQKDG